MLKNVGENRYEGKTNLGLILIGPFLLNLCHGYFIEQSFKIVICRTSNSYSNIGTDKRTEKRSEKLKNVPIPQNLTQNKETTLPKFFGSFQYESMGKTIRICVMNNILPSTLKYHEKYDLKGSMFKRQAGHKERVKSSPTLKDLDFLEEHPGVSVTSRSKPLAIL